MRLFLLIFHLVFALSALFFVVYLLPQSPPFPNHLPDAVQSLELADTETPLRRGYYTNYTREQVVKFYQSQFGNVSILGFSLPTMHLNYPPENAFSLIRDQTKSSYLEEITHPYRESVYINGFLPTLDKDDIWYKGVHYSHKITVRYAPSILPLRLFFASLTLFFLYFVFFRISRELLYAIRAFITLIILK